MCTGQIVSAILEFICAKQTSKANKAQTTGTITQNIEQWPCGQKVDNSKRMAWQIHGISNKTHGTSKITDHTLTPFAKKNEKKNHFQVYGDTLIWIVLPLMFEISHCPFSSQV